MQSLKVAVLFGLITIFLCAHKPLETVERTKWMTLPEAAEGLKKLDKPVLIDLYTDWCGWCKVMDKKTYSNKNVSEYLAQKFYPVKINAESREAIEWNGKKYFFNQSYKTNDFAIYLTGGQLSYPTTVIIPPNGEPQAIPGFLSPKDLEVIVKYFGEGKFGKVNFPEYHKNFKSTW